TDSLTSLVDVESGKIAVELMEALGIAKYRDYLSDPVRSDEVVGTLLDSFADEVGLQRGLPVIAGALDTSATAVGLGAIHEKDVCVILGTTCANEIVLRKEDCDFGAENSRFEKHPLGELYVELQPTLNGTPNIDWMLEHIAQTKDFQEIDKMVSKTPVGCGGVVYHPYISVAGERAPFYHPYARASFFGISQVTTREDLIRAVYEGISMSIRDCLQNVDKDATIYLAGGGAKSPVWAQMIADVLGLKVMIPAGRELGAKGVALMVGVRQGLYKDYEEAVKKACTFRQVYHPNLVNTRKYDLIYELYKKVRIHNQEIWDYRHQMNKKIKAISQEEVK
ncbi:MAG: carbohydrate kinase, partial [Lachnospiraceae bacterium]|nr:carbohydrate kinase [Lachnospiraceae bacterium]